MFKFIFKRSEIKIEEGRQITMRFTVRAKHYSILKFRVFGSRRVSMCSFQLLRLIHPCDNPVRQKSHEINPRVDLPKAVSDAEVVMALRTLPPNLLYS